MVIVGAVPLKAVPSERVPLIVPAPVAVIIKLVEFPEQIVFDPLKIPVGLGLTVTVALPVLSLLIEVQVLLVKVEMV